MVDRAPAAGPQAARRRQPQGRLRGRRATQRRRTATIIAPSISSWPAGSRCATCTIRATAYAHFTKIAESAENPISLARGAYWSGRAAEALHKTQEAKQRYQEAARYPTAYYGQIARAKAGLGELALNPFPALSSADRNRAMSSDLVRAAELLYAVEARDLAWTMMADLGDKSTDIATLAVLSELTAKYRDARGMLLLGKLALARGYALDHAAFPTLGVPDYTPIGPPVEPALVYSIVRQESWFNPKTVSTRQRARPDAGHARRRQVHRQASSRPRSTRSGC